jgi:hypothetical protein
MTSFDLSRLPTGEMGWNALLEWAAESDDRVERYFLELKSEIDLNGKSGRHKVAKFILGAANRDPARAAKRLEGHAIMLLGVGTGDIPGIGGFEAKDLARDVRKFTGTPGPKWDFERIRLSNGKDAIAVVVDPPIGQIWPCLADGIDLVDGDIYLRGDGETAKAKGLELQAMLTRVASTSALPHVGVELFGSIYAIRVDRSFLTDWITERADGYRSQLPPRAGAGTIVIGSYERRSESEFLEEVKAWEDKSIIDPLTGLHNLAAELFDGISFQVANQTKAFLEDVQLDLAVVPGPIALEWREKTKSIDLFTTRPSNWGTESFATMLGRNNWVNNIRSATTNGELQIGVSDPIRLSLPLASLRPKETFDTTKDEVVLVHFHEEEPPDHIMARWRLTARGFDDVLEGEFKIPVQSLDWRESLAEILGVEK